MTKKVKVESELLAELQILCSKPGFIHAFSYLCRRDGTLNFVGGVKYEDMLKFYGNARLLRTELSTLHGLILKSGYKTDIIEPEKIEEYVRKAEELLEEIHSSMIVEMNKRFTRDNLINLNMEEFFSHPAALRESIFYSAEEAYDFQYCDFSVIRYENDAEWLHSNIGFNMNEANKIYKSITNNLNNNIEQYRGQEGIWSYHSYLDNFTLDIEFLVQDSKLSIDTINSFLNIFSHSGETENNGSFASIDDFNIVNPKPISKFGNKYYLFQIYPLAQSMYESPIFWMREDKKYFREVAQDNRGAFTENFAYEKLKKIFGEKNVYTNIDIYENASKRIGEIDILAIFGGKCLIIQAKSKALTIEARKGNVDLVKDDFTKGFQKAYDQAVVCKDALLQEGITLKNADGEIVELKEKITAVYPICLTSESYPSLSFQCKQFLKYKTDDMLNPPFVMSVFLLDVLVEFLFQPLYLLSYIDRRCNYMESIVASNEFVLLSQHLKRNLWLQDDYNFMLLDDDIASDLDAAFMVRRLGLPGKRTPDGIMKRWQENFIGKLLFKINRVPNDPIIDFGLTILKMSGDFLDLFDQSVRKLSFDSIQDGTLHDASFLVEGKIGGITIHTMFGDLKERQAKLASHVEIRKYKEKSEAWVGLIINHKTGFFDSLCCISYPWVRNLELDKEIAKRPKSKIQDVQNLKKKLKFKVKRNDQCPCGSGSKFKKCCM
ncbi:SEC-C metal-binding domain-containing protein [Aliivibrio fischeri]|uniref:SEC-C metal-binding domain-containing protein n=1 Tax=Aliivibrio fischeri TaxID=668 RepID=UPI00080E44F7|nr:SEC-C metal-binding domain-containing protein [Aliivibrio fischeri]OCH05054.1 SecA-like protein [Aliivibrio fischeri]